MASMHFNKWQEKHKLNCLSRVTVSKNYTHMFTQILAKQRLNMTSSFCVNKSSVVCNNIGELHELWLKVWLDSIFFKQYLNTNQCNIRKTLKWRRCGSEMRLNHMNYTGVNGKSQAAVELFYNHWCHKHFI